MAKSDYLEDAIIDHVLRNTALTSPTTVYVTLSTADPTDSGGSIAEPVGNGFAREAATFGAPSNGASSNSGAITFGPASGGSWGLLTHFAIFDALTSGNMLYHGTLTASKTVGDGDSIEFATSNLTVTEA